MEEHQSTGVLLVAQHAPIKMAIDEIVIIWELTDAATWRNQIARLPLVSKL